MYPKYFNHSLDHACPRSTKKNLFACRQGYMIMSPTIFLHIASCFLSCKLRIFSGCLSELKIVRLNCFSCCVDNRTYLFHSYERKPSKQKRASAWYPTSWNKEHEELHNNRSARKPHHTHLCLRRNTLVVSGFDMARR